MRDYREAESGLHGGLALGLLLERGRVIVHVQPGVAFRVWHSGPSIAFRVWDFRFWIW